MSVSSPDPNLSLCGSPAVVTGPEGRLESLESDFLGFQKFDVCKFLRRARIPESERYSLEPIEVLIEDKDNEFSVALICSAASRREMKA